MPGAVDPQQLEVLEIQRKLTEARSIGPGERYPQERRYQSQDRQAVWSLNAPDVAEIVDIAPTDTVPVRLRRYVPQDDQGDLLVVLFHGGGWVFGTLDDYDAIARRMSTHLRAVVITVDYGLAPEHVLPTQIDQAVAALIEICAGMARGKDGGRKLVVGGDSAGANIAVAALLDPRSPPADAALLFYGCYEIGRETPSAVAFSDSFGPSVATIRQRVRAYVGPDGAPDDPRFAVLNGEVERLPPTVLVPAEFDMLRSDSEALAIRLSQVGVRYSIYMGEGLCHGFLINAGHIDRVTPMLKEVGVGLRALIGQSS